MNFDCFFEAVAFLLGLDTRGIVLLLLKRNTRRGISRRKIAESQDHWRPPYRSIRMPHSSPSLLKIRFSDELHLSDYTITRLLQN